MKVYNLENIKSATELKHRTEVISMNERSIIVLDTFTGIAQKLQAVSISLFRLVGSEMCIRDSLLALPKSCKLFLFLYSISISKRL